MPNQPTAHFPFSSFRALSERGSTLDYSTSQHFSEMVPLSAPPDLATDLNNYRQSLSRY